MPPAPHADARRRIVDDLVARGAVAVVRLPDAERALAVVDALAAGGVTAIELTLTTPGALDLIAALRKAGGDALLVGAGSVLDADTARRAVEAGATYVVSPVFRAEVVAESHRQGVPAMPGAYTPTEILTAHEAGADVVKVFPADTLGPAYLKGVMAPMPFLRLMPTGGVTPANVGDWLRAGAVAAGLGSALVDAKLVAAGDMSGITARARQTSENVAAARGGQPVAVGA